MNHLKKIYKKLLLMLSKNNLLNLVKSIRNDNKKLIAVGTLGFVILVLFISFIRGLIIASNFEDFQSFSPKDINKEKRLLEVNLLIELPTDKKGRVGTIKNIEALAKRHEEFKKAKNGDLVVAYQNMTIIYDPINKNVIDISTKNLLR